MMEVSTTYPYISVADLPHAHGAPEASAGLKQNPADFRVEEILKFTPCGEGEHVYVYVEKNDLNTEDIKRHLARCAAVNPMHVAYAGLKDRRAVTRQWFSVYLPKADFDVLPLAGMKVLQTTRHQVKLRSSMLSKNQFQIVLRDLRGNREDLIIRLEQVKLQGVPNYYGEQRFSKDNKNLVNAARLFERRLGKCSKFKRGIYLSAARSYLYNCVLSERVLQGSWNVLIPGDVAILNGSRSYFQVSQVDQELRQRLDRWDIHPSGPLWGRGETATQGDCARLELQALEAQGQFRQGLESAGLKQERRGLRLSASDLYWEIDNRAMVLRFSLMPGEFATSLIRECVRVTE